MYHTGDQAGATRQLKECLALRPADAEADLIDSLSVAAKSSAALGAATVPATHAPLERIKCNYDESTFRNSLWECRRPPNNVSPSPIPQPMRVIT